MMPVRIVRRTKDSVVGYRAIASNSGWSDVDKQFVQDKEPPPRKSESRVAPILRELKDETFDRTEMDLRLVEPIWTSMSPVVGSLSDGEKPFRVPPSILTRVH